MLSFDGIIEELLLTSGKTEGKKAFLTIIAVAVEFVPGKQVNHFVGKIARKIDQLGNDLTSEDVSALFELILTVFPYATEFIVNELQLPHRILCNLLGFEPNLPQIPEKTQIYHADAYLGHPMAAYPSNPVRSKAIKLGFQLAILCHSFQYMDCPEVWPHFWSSTDFSLLSRPTAYERQQVGLLLSCFPQFPANLLANQSNSTEEVTNYTISTLMYALRFSENRLAIDIAQALLKVTR